MTGRVECTRSHKQYWCEDPDCGAALGPCELFFGFQSRKRDWLYAEEFAQFAASGVLSAAHYAASRDGPDRVYVQDLIRDHAEVVYEMAAA